MTTILCTLYNSLYLDKGLVLYDSLCECARDFKLYVLCMDDKCFDVLTRMNQANHIPVRLADFESGDGELQEAKTNRSVGEYCWTCSSSFIRYIFKHYGEENCTYIDADMFFYNDPKVLIDEMLEAGKSVLVVPHRFPEKNKEMAQKVGSYCVEFNTFLNTPESLDVLEYWRTRCLECCSNLGDGIHWGDQKYLDELVEKFENVHVCKNYGAGIAPWNLSLYKSVGNGKLVFVEDNVVCAAVFYHYQGITNINRSLFVLGVEKPRFARGKDLIELFYRGYLKRIQNCKYRLAEYYGVEEIIMGHPAKRHHLVSLKKTAIGGFMYYIYLSLFCKVSTMKVPL